MANQEPKDDIVERVRHMFEVANTGYAKLEDVGRLFLALNQSVKDLGSEVDARVKALGNEWLRVIRGELKDAVDASEKKLLKNVDDTKASLTTDIQTVRGEVEAVRRDIPTVPEVPSLTPLWERIKAVAESIPKALFAEDIRNYLELLQGKDRLHVSAIDGLQELLDEAKASGKTVTVGGGPRGMLLYIDGVKKGLIANMNIASGTGMAIAYSKVNGMDTLTFNSSGGAGSITVETPPETPDGIITLYTVSAEPKYVVADGTTYFDGAGYTYSTGTITFGIPPSATVRVII